MMTTTTTTTIDSVPLPPSCELSHLNREARWLLLLLSCSQPAHCSFACLINFPCSRAHTGQCVWFMTDKTAALALAAAALAIFWSSVQLQQPPPPHLYRHRPSSFSSVHFEAHTDALAHKIWYSYKLFHTVFLRTICWGWGEGGLLPSKKAIFSELKLAFFCLSAYSSNSSCMPLYNPPVLCLSALTESAAAAAAFDPLHILFSITSCCSVHVFTSTETCTYLLNS